jgi:hypothetical protein
MNQIIRGKRTNNTYVHHNWNTRSLGNAGSEHIGFCIDSRGFDYLRLQRPIMTQLELPGLALCWPPWVSSISARNVQKCIEDDILRYRDFG